TGGQGVISLNMEDIQIKENSLIHIAPNMLLGPLPENQSLSISGLSFTTDFIAEIGLPEGTSEIFSYFSSKFFPVWNLIPEDAVLVKRQIRVLVEHIKEYAIHPYGKEILIHGFYIFMFEIRSEEHTSELQSRENLVCRLLLEKKKKKKKRI